ncbi:uncharacterized protein PHACADRAFT_131449 [Phanerochaete carnosa HHB-10118-sp]|uniref:NADP-dependent oxidoreductase domain-containing protein n=1 Tax=Phanerochaete carnosa (strain HHB-10118-sp) TaxID=650164 RepID=K5UJF5_PHACS|nr:uncharacterized protein PHACADRAFT_131449 [Phanerochaete carnosa HHB-10118-sp]EKM49696.1 hypothetical protein PHACADRAFT_131449 [Phanerochaete carnosa HHB-10118-sp]
MQKFVDIMIRHGHSGVDTARMYCKGTSEELIGTLDLRNVLHVDTKIFPTTPGDHSQEKLGELFDASLNALNGKKIRVFYLHAPDHSVPFEDTLEVVTEIWKSGGFQEFGLSNFAAWEVADIVGICESRGFVMPTVYEGPYNIVDRLAEDELFPCLRKFNIRYASYCPLAGGYLTGRFFVPDDTKEITLGNFSAKNPISGFYTSRYLNFSLARSVAELLEIAETHNLTLSEVALRWLQWHSKLQPDDHGVIVAADDSAQLETNLSDCEKGPLPDAVAQACEDAWKKAKSAAPKYWI